MTPDDLETLIFRDVVANTFAADAALDAERFVSKLSPSAAFRLGGQPAVMGREAIRAVVSQTFAAFRAIEHRLIAAVERPDLLIYEAEITYSFPDGRHWTAPYVNVLRFDGELVSDYRIYIDLASFSPPGSP